MTQEQLLPLLGDTHKAIDLPAMVKDFRTASDRGLHFVGSSPESIIIKVGYWEYPTRMELLALKHYFDHINIEVFSDPDSGQLYSIECILKKAKENLLSKIIKIIT